jgi:hypothetical protein
MESGVNIAVKVKLPQHIIAYYNNLECFSLEEVKIYLIN